MNHFLLGTLADFGANLGSPKRERVILLSRYREFVGSLLETFVMFIIINIVVCEAIGAFGNNKVIGSVVAVRDFAFAFLCGAVHV